MRRFQNEAHWWAEQFQTEIKYTVSYAWWGQKLWWLFSFGFKKMMTLREDNLSQSEGPLLINCLSTWRPYCNPLLTNHDANYNLRRTLLMLSGQFANTWRLQTCFFLYVKSLFTNIPLQLVLQSTETAVELPLPTKDIIDLLNLFLTSTYFQYNGKHYKMSCMEQPWGGLCLLLSQKLWCNT